MQRPDGETEGGKVTDSETTLHHLQTNKHASLCGRTLIILKDLHSLLYAPAATHASVQYNHSRFTEMRLSEDTSAARLLRKSST